MSLQEILECCHSFPALLGLQLDTLSNYISLVRHFKPRIAFTQASTLSGVPDGLPHDIHYFLSLALDLDDYGAQLCWTALRHIAWMNNAAIDADWKALVPIFLEHGSKLGLHIQHFLPPVRSCINPECQSNPSNIQGRNVPDLGEDVTIQVTYFTKTHGALPASATSTYCRGCSTRYHHNCYVRDNIRTYYTEDICNHSTIQITTHFFFDAGLCESFARDMAMSWTSTQNCAHIYNEDAAELAWATDLPLDWPLTFVLNYEYVSNAFYTYSLIMWHRDSETILQVPHRAPDQAQRWNGALTARNIALAGPGQPMWSHACNLCTKHVKDENGNLVAAFRSTVTDGVSLGHPCCAVHDCKEMLMNTRDRVCATHRALRNQCAVVSCNETSERGFRTCSLLSHRLAEQRYLDCGTAMFQLKQRLAQSHPFLATENSDISPPEDDADTADQDEVVVDMNGEVYDACDNKPEGGVRKAFARFGRRRTHNEELCVASCGVILGRATFYGAEGPNSVAVFWKELFPTKASIPAVNWHDNNCHVAEMLAKAGDTYFNDVALPVDVFHLKSKHKVADGFCGKNCNPAMWPELMDEKTGKWIFNSSAAEQANGWIVGYKAMTRLMRQDRYNFLLDEMIMRRNRFTIRRLERDGHAPYLIPRAELLGN